MLVSNLKTTSWGEKRTLLVLLRGTKSHFDLY